MPTILQTLKFSRSILSDGVVKTDFYLLSNDKEPSLHKIIQIRKDVDMLIVALICEPYFATFVLTAYGSTWVKMKHKIGWGVPHACSDMTKFP